MEKEARQLAEAKTGRALETTGRGWLLCLAQNHMRSPVSLGRRAMSTYSKDPPTWVQIPSLPCDGHETSAESTQLLISASSPLEGKGSIPILKELLHQ